MMKKNKNKNKKAGNTFLAVLFALANIVIAIKGDFQFLTGIGWFVSAISSAYFTALLWE